MSDDPYAWVWISPIYQYLHFLIMPLYMAYFLYKRKQILKERGQKGTGYVIHMWALRKKNGDTTYKIKYRFTFKDNAYKKEAELSYLEWNKLTKGSAIEIIFDPQNPELYNIPLSQAGGQCWDAIFIGIMGIGWILGFGLGFGIGVFEFTWYHTIITTFVIPGGLFIVIRILFYFCCPSCCDGTKQNQINQQDYQIVKEGDQQKQVPSWRTSRGSS